MVVILNCKNNCFTSSCTGAFNYITSSSSSDVKISIYSPGKNTILHFTLTLNVRFKAINKSSFDLEMLFSLGETWVQSKSRAERILCIVSRNNTITRLLTAKFLQQNFYFPFQLKGISLIYYFSNYYIISIGL